MHTPRMSISARARLPTRPHHNGTFTYYPIISGNIVPSVPASPHASYAPSDPSGAGTRRA